MGDEVGILGLGNIGGGMARRLAGSGWQVSGYDVSPEATERAREVGVRVAGCARELAASVPVLVTSLPNPTSVLGTCLGDDGVLDAMGAGAVLVETSTIDPHAMEEVGREADARGVRTLDVTLSGEPPQAAAGQLVLMVGAFEARVRNGTVEVRLRPC
jgi:3-hydroxyisobutyrate dehydrogenase